MRTNVHMGDETRGFACALAPGNGPQGSGTRAAEYPVPPELSAAVSP